ncbi:MAG: LysR family transcriptional regulator, partial [Comamonadaceae bacterium]
HQRHPGITLTLHDVVSDACIARVRDGSVDFAVASRPPEGEDMETRLLSEDNFYLVCRRGHPLSSKGGLRARDLAGHGFISLSHDSSVRQNLDRALHPVKLQTVMQLEHLATVAGMVQAGLGITVVPELTLFQFTRPGLVVRPLKIPGLARSIYVVRRRGRTLSAAASALYDHMMSERGKIHDYLRMQLGAAAV